MQSGYLRPSAWVVRHRATALSAAPSAHSWLRHTSHARVLHVFDRACNLVNQADEVVSLVAPEVGEGPFAMVVPVAAPFSDWIDGESPVAVRDETLEVGPLQVDTFGVSVWNARPDWENARRSLPGRGRHIAALIDVLCARTPSESRMFVSGATRLGMPFRAERGLPAPIEGLCGGIAHDDLGLCRAAARRLAGLGQGLTPAGDDFLLGAMYAVWMMRPPEEAALLAEAIAWTAIPLTASLSAAWLQAAARGEAAAPWHTLVEALACSDRAAVLGAAERILNTGYTSGSDALAGFVITLDKCFTPRTVL